MTKDRIPPEVLEHFKMWDEIEEETDRGAAVMAHAYLDNRLREAIWSHFVERGRTAKELLDNGPLGTFAIRIKLLYSLGFFGKQILRDLNTVGIIRNSFAHSKETISFTDPSIKTMCETLHYRYYKQKISGPRENYLMAVSILANIIKYESERNDRRYESPIASWPD